MPPPRARRRRPRGLVLLVIGLTLRPHAADDAVPSPLTAINDSGDPDNSWQLPKEPDLPIAMSDDGEAPGKRLRKLLSWAALTDDLRSIEAWTALCARACKREMERARARAPRPR